MLQQRQYYRKKLVTKGLVLLAGHELNIIVKNLSVKGFLAECEDREIVNRLDEIFAAIKASTTIDFFLPELQLTGDAEMVRVDLKDEVFLLALEFRNFSYVIRQGFYEKQTYKKQLKASGNIFLNGKNHQFISCNISQDGLLIHLPGKLSIERKALISFDFQGFELKGEGKVVWLDNKDDQTLLGLKFLSKDNIR